MTKVTERRPRGRPKGRYKNSRRSQIVSAAANLFAEQNYADVTMDDIATAVGLAKPTLYYYYKSKDLLLFAMHERMFDFLLGRHAERERSASARAELEAILQDMFDLVKDEPGLLRAFIGAERQLPENLQVQVREQRDKYQEIVRGVIESGIEGGEFRDLDARLATVAVFSIGNWSYQWYRPGREKNSVLAKKFCDLLVGGLSA